MHTQAPDIDEDTESVAKLSGPDAEIGLRQLFSLILQHKVSIVVIVLLFTGTAVAGLAVVSKRYEAVAIVSPVTDQQGGDKMGSLTSQLGGIAALAGIGSSSPGKRAESIATLQSEQLTERYLRENNLLPVIFAKQWDPKAQAWKGNAGEPPTYWTANRYFKSSVRRVTEDPKTGLVSIFITWKDPVLAAKWANDLVKMTNDYLRDKMIKESERRIAYLTDQAARANSVEVKSSIYSVLESEIKSQTVARGSDEYALKVIDPAFVPEKASYPMPALWIALGVLGGLVASLIFALIRADWVQGAHVRR